MPAVNNTWEDMSVSGATVAGVLEDHILLSELGINTSREAKRQTF